MSGKDDTPSPGAHGSGTVRRGGARRLVATLDGAERTFLLYRSGMVAGSAPDCDVVLPVVGVSRRHARFVLEAESLRVEDLGSRNGTFVGAEEVSAAEARLSPGDTLRLGPLRLRVEEAEEADARVAFMLPPETHAGTAVSEPVSSEPTRTVADAEEVIVSSGGPDLRMPPGIVLSRAPEMRRVYSVLRSASRAGARILLLGETGVGKEHLARAVHDTSERADGPWVAINCAAIPAELLESELFGIERGVATGVDKRRGAFRQAEGGTLLLDEVGELASELQAKLLRVLEEGEVRPVGGPPHAVDVRVVSATNVELQQRIHDGRFRADLYYRLAGTVVRVPPLRRRRDDVPTLTEHFLRRHAEKAAEAGHRVLGLSAGALDALVGRPWPGNVRELETEIRRLVWACEPGQIIDSRLVEADPHAPEAVPETPEEADDLTLARHVREVERRVIEEALRRTEGSQRQAAKLLNIARNTLAKKIRELGIET